MSAIALLETTLLLLLLLVAVFIVRKELPIEDVWMEEIVTQAADDDTVETVSTE